MKKIISTILVVAMLFSLVACGGANTEIENGMTKWLDSQNQIFATYMPHNQELIKNYKMKEVDGYIVYSLTNDNDNVIATVKNSIVDGKIDLSVLDANLAKLTIEGNEPAINTTQFPIISDDKFSSEVVTVTTEGKDVEIFTKSNIEDHYIQFSKWGSNLLFVMNAKDDALLEKEMNAYIASRDEFAGKVEKATFGEYSVWVSTTNNAGVLEAVKKAVSGDKLNKEALQTSLETTMQVVPSINYMGWSTLDTTYLMEDFIPAELLSEAYIANSTVIAVTPILIFKAA